MITLRAGQKTSAPFPISVAPASPALFTAGGTGIGQALALDAAGTLNSPSNPAPHGSILTIACTGDGGLPLQVVLAGRALTASDIVYTGPMQPGVLQISLRVPDWTPAGDAVAVLVVLGPDAQGRFYYSRDGVTLAFGS
jgi:uncharacterized protein (TIGR03437 family)